MREWVKAPRRAEERKRIPQVSGGTEYQGIRISGYGWPDTRVVHILWEHRSLHISWNRQLSTSRQCALQMHSVTSIFGVRWWNQVQNVRAQCPHLSAFLKKCSDQNCRYATWKTCTLPFRSIFGILRQALPRPLFGRRMRTPNRYKSVMVALRAALRARKRGSMIILIFHRV